MTDKHQAIRDALRDWETGESGLPKHKILSFFQDSCNPTAITELLARMDAAEADAERYRWLRNRIPGSAYRIAGVIYSEGGAGVDTDIDTAMQENSR